MPRLDKERNQKLENQAQTGSVGTPGTACYGPLFPETNEPLTMKQRLLSKRSGLLNQIKEINNAIQALELSNAEEVLKDSEQILYS